MSKFQVVEKGDFGTDWALVRDDRRNAADRFNTEEEAYAAAEQYLTDLNCNNALTKAEKRGAIEAFMLTDEGCFLGVLDGEKWYMTDRHDKPVDEKYFELEGKTQVAVRPVPGT